MSVDPSKQPPHLGQQGPNPPAYLQLEQAPPQQQAARAYNGWAIACFVCGLLSILGVPILLCWIFGFIASFQIARTGQKGRLLAHLGLSASGLWILFIMFKAAELTP